MAREDDRIDNRIACLRTEHLAATLISDAGYHCEVWRSSGSILRDGERHSLDRVIKIPRTAIDGEPSVIAMAPNIRRWFDVANPANEAELAPMIGRDGRLREALGHFTASAEHWYARDERVIDLYGVDNLVLDRNHHLHYIDSFGVFFHADLLAILPDPDAGLAERIRISRLRLDYLNHLLETADECT